VKGGEGTRAVTREWESTGREGGKEGMRRGLGWKDGWEKGLGIRGRV